MGKYFAAIQKNILKILEPIVVVLLTFFVFCLVYKSWIPHFSIPIKYQGDVAYTLATIKTISEKGWYYQTDRLGAPFQANNLDYTSPENLLYFTLKCINLITNNIFLTLNIFFLLTFFTTSLTTYYVFKYFRINRVISLAGSQLFAFTPYHLIRGESHLFLSTYFFIPLIFLICYWIFTNELNKKRIFLSILIILITASSGVYYAFFSTFFIVVSGFITFLRKNYKATGIAFLFTIVMCVGLLINLLPNLTYSNQNGKNIIATNRNPNESEFYGLKISTLFVPNSAYHIAKLHNILVNFYSATYLKSEYGNYLGLIGITGFILLLINLFIEKNKKNKLTISLTYFNIAALLLAVNFGFGSIIAYLITAKIRAYQRICIFIYLFSLFYVCYLTSLKINKSKFYLLLIIPFFVIGLIDQANITMPTYEEIKSEYDSDNQIISNIEAKVPNSMIFQLPYKQFPESAPVNLVTDYDLLKPYLFSNTIKWTYGTMKGRGEDAWYQQVSGLPTEKMIDTLCSLNFSGVLINRKGYQDGGLQLEKSFKDLKGSTIESQNKTWVFYGLENCKNSKTFKNEIIEKPIIIENTGCYKKETLEKNYWQWCQQKGSFVIKNYSGITKKIVLDFDLQSASDNSTITFYNRKINQIFNSTNQPKHYQFELDLAPGTNQINFKYSGKPTLSSTDSRQMYFKLINLNFNDKNIIY